ncbi:MAG: DNA-processing protein DprA [Planctomycetes bacterium]|nr:DNA-processing protein DprA [Planctomycetota bacterium]NUQ33971.1 DNA-protecting protein DprA [Planctomycetaceae bacterium]
MNERTEELRLRVAAALARKFSPLQLHEVRKRFGSLWKALAAPKGELTSIKGITISKISLLKETLASGAVEKELERCAASNTTHLMPEDAGYPRLLKEIADPPVVLWMRGTLTDEDQLCVAIVGSRNADYYGMQQAARFSRDLGARRITVVSGLARGIDTAAHTATLEAGGRTIAVVGSGFDELYPPENVRLAKEIEKQGALVSEFPLATPAHAKNFPQRNRIISGLCAGVIVAQATKRSGSLITARFASEQGREVFAIPGKIDSGEHEGCHALIKEGAKLVENVGDVLAELHGLDQLPAEAAPPREKQAFKGTAAELALYTLLKPSDPVNVETLIASSGMPAAQVNATLMTLEMRKLVHQLPGKNYVRTGP